MALGFNYTLSVDEDNSLRSLTKFLEKVEGQKVVLGLDFDMNALSDMLKKIQTEITNASKNLTLTFGSFRVDEDELHPATPAHFANALRYNKWYTASLGVILFLVAITLIISLVEDSLLRFSKK